MNALFFSNSKVDITERAILIPNGPDITKPSSWIYVNNKNIAHSMNNVFKNHYNAYMINLKNAVDPKWIIKHSISTEKFLDNKLNDLVFLKVKATSPPDIYNEQISLSKDAKYIQAFDMTDVDEWFDESGLGECLRFNIESAKKPEGTNNVRRIFLVSSRSILEKNVNFKNKLTQVVKIHIDNGVGCGLVFREEMKKKEYIKDFAVYDKKVVWIETVPTDKYSGGGYFSTDNKTVREHIDIFNKVWNTVYLRKPEEEANELIRNA